MKSIALLRPEPNVEAEEMEQIIAVLEEAGYSVIIATEPGSYIVME